MDIRNLKREYRNGGELDIWIRTNGKIVIFGILLITGIVFGAFISAWLKINGLNGLFQTMDIFIDNRKTQNIYRLFLSALAPNIIAWIVLLICGFCAVSLPLIAAVPCIRGIYYGIITCAMLISGSGAGLKYILLYMLPNFIISAVVIILCCCNAAEMSNCFWQALSPTSRIQNNNKTALPLFCGKMILYAIFIIGGALIEAYCISYI